MVGPATTRRPTRRAARRGRGPGRHHQFNPDARDQPTLTGNLVNTATVAPPSGVTKINPNKNSSTEPTRRRRPLALRTCSAPALTFSQRSWWSPSIRARRDQWQNVNNYQIVTLGGPGVGGSLVGHVTPVARAVYDPGNDTVTLFLVAALISTIATSSLSTARRPPVFEPGGNTARWRGQRQARLELRGHDHKVHPRGAINRVLPGRPAQAEDTPAGGGPTRTCRACRQAARGSSGSDNFEKRPLP